MESLTPEVAPFGLHTMLVEPGLFRTEPLTPESIKYPEPSIDVYAERIEQTITTWNGMNGQQGGDPPSSPTPAHPARKPGPAAAPFRRRRRRRSNHRAQVEGPPGPSGRPSASCPADSLSTTP